MPETNKLEAGVAGVHLVSRVWTDRFGSRTRARKFRCSEGRAGRIDGCLAEVSNLRGSSRRKAELKTQNLLPDVRLQSFFAFCFGPWLGAAGSSAFGALVLCVALRPSSVSGKLKDCAKFSQPVKGKPSSDFEREEGKKKGGQPHSDLVLPPHNLNRS